MSILSPTRNFGRFVTDTSYVTVAERTPDTQDFPDADPAFLVPGSQVFVPTPGPVALHDWTQWWYWVPGADWRHPEGPDSDVRGKELHPVVHVGLEDARAYAEWAEKRLPTEAEWEHAARGGLDGATYAWGDEFMPGGRIMANTWHGMFPFENRHPHGFTRTSPVKHFPPNGYSLYDVAGNVWEWTSTRWSPDHAAGRTSPHVAGGRSVLWTGCTRARGGSIRDQGWFASVCLLVLPSLPAVRPPAPGTPRHRQSPRVPLRPGLLMACGSGIIPRRPGPETEAPGCPATPSVSSLHC